METDTPSLAGTWEPPHSVPENASRRRLLAAACAGALSSLALKPAAAQGAPMRIVVGFAAGGSADVVARVLGDALQHSLDRTVIVENRPGAAGRLAIEYVKNAPADGNTLLVVPHGPVTLFPHVFKNLKFDMEKDFAPISRIATGDYALVIGPAVPAKDLKGFIAWAKAPGRKVSFGSPGSGTVPHLLGVSMGKEMGIEWTHVPYRGLALAMNDLAAGVVSAVVSTLTETLELHKAGRVRILATAGDQRSSFVEGIPTFKESGIDVDVSLWFGAYTRTGTPPAMLERLRTALTSDLRAPALKQKFSSLGLVPAPNTPAEQLALQQSETQMWGRVVKESGFTPED